jgi:DNA-binding NarL/FixJ family response regulator
MTTVLLIEYPPAVRQALRARLSLERDLDIVGEADDGLQGIALAQALDPDVVLIDAETPDLDTARTVRELARTNASTGIVVLCHHTTALADEAAGIPAVVVGMYAGSAALVAAIRSAARQNRRDS